MTSEKTNLFNSQIKHTELKHKRTLYASSVSHHTNTSKAQLHFYFGHCDKLPNRENINELLIRTNKRTAQKNNVCVIRKLIIQRLVLTLFLCVCKFAREALLQGSQDKLFFMLSQSDPLFSMRTKVDMKANLILLPAVPGLMKI